MAKYDNKHVPDVKMLRSLGAAIRSVRHKKSLTIEELSNRAKINFKYLQRCETGKNNLSVSVLLAIASGLEISPETLIRGALKKSR